MTGKFIHQAANIVDVQVEGQSEPIGTTSNHPFWSEDRQSFIPAGDLHPGERLRTLNRTPRPTDALALQATPRGPPSTARVLSVTPRRTTHTVYNLEVDTEHVYNITPDGVLVHNECLKNAVDGARRFKEALAKIKAQFPNATILTERTFRDVNHNRLIDATTNSGRRMDIVVVQKGKVTHLFEVTSMRAEKSIQSEKTTRLLRDFQVYIRDPKTRKLLKVAKHIKETLMRLP